MKSERDSDFVLIFGLVAIGLFLGYRPVVDMDYHFHLAMGRAHLHEGPRLASDPITFLDIARSPDMGAWGAATIFAALDQWGGTAAVQALFAVLAAASLVLTHRHALRVTGRRDLAFVIVAFTCAAATHRFRIRPDLFTLIAIVALLDLLQRPPTTRTALGLFALCLGWAQLHPGVLIAPVLAGLRAVGGDWRRRLIQPIAAAIGLSITPRGPLDSIDLALETSRCGDLVPEWGALFSLDARIFGASWALWAVVAFLALASMPRLLRADIGLALLVLCCLFAPVDGARLLYLAPLALAPALAQSSVTSRPIVARTLVILATLAIIFMPLRDRVERAQACRQVGLSPFAPLFVPNFPVAAGDFLERVDLEGRIFTPVRWGGYVGLRRSPRQRTAHDGRVSLFGRDVVVDLLRFSERSQRERIVDRLALEVLVVPPGSISGEEVGDIDGGGRFVPVFADPTAAIYVDRRGPHWPRNRVRLVGR